MIDNTNESIVPEDEQQSKKNQAIDQAEMHMVNKKAEMTDLIINGDDSEKYIQAATKLKEIALRLTKPTDWVKFGETLYIQDQRLAELNTYMQSLFGLNITVLRPTESKETYRKKVTNKYKDTSGKDQSEEIEVDVIEYTFTGGVLIEEVKEVPGRIRRTRTIEPIMGSCSTADEMFGKVNGVFTDPKYIQPSKIMKKAQANYRGNCMRYLWGLKGITEADLAKVFSEDEMKLIKDSTVRGAKQHVDPKDVGTLEDLRTRILRAHDNNNSAAREFLKENTKFKGKEGKSDFSGYTDINRLQLNSFPHKRVVMALEKIEKEKGLDPTKTTKAPKKSKPAAENDDTMTPYEKLTYDIADCKNTHEVLNVEAIVKRNDTLKQLTKEQQEDLREKIGVRYRELDKGQKNRDALPY